jgi:hypothetical protein
MGTLKKRIHKAKQKVRGYTRKDGLYVKPYKRTPVTAKRRKILKAARELEAKLKNPLRPGWVRYEGSEQEERISYTYKVEILVRSDYKYRMFFTENPDGTTSRAGVPKGVPEDSMSLQYWHSRFEPTIKKASVDFLSRVPEIRAYGDVRFMSIELYRVSGEGPLRVKKWKLLASFDEPEDIK